MEHVGRLRDGAGGAIPERAGGLALCTAGVDGPASKKRGDVVKHYGDDNFVGTGIDLEDSGNGAPKEAPYDAGDEGQRQVDEDGQAFKVDADGDGEDRAHHELA